MNDSITEWVAKAQTNETTAPEQKGVRVIRREQPQQSIGQLIMKVADKIRPHIAAMCEGVRNNEGTLLQPAHIRGIALEVAEGLVRDAKLKAANQ